jgi:hypothetical protein
VQAVLALACIAGEAHAFNRAYTESGAPLHWVDECVYFTLAAPGSDDVDDFDALTEAVRRGFEAWNVDCSAMRYVYGGVSDCSGAGYSPGRPHANLVIWLEDEWPYEVDLGDALAATSVYYDPDTGEILDADVEFNGVDFEWTTDGVPGRRDVWNTMAHEAGHVLGLDHADIEGATMYVYSVPGDTDKRDLDPDDEDGVCTIYAEGTDLAPCSPPPGDGALCRGDSSGCSCARRRSGPPRPARSHRRHGDRAGKQAGQTWSAQDRAAAHPERRRGRSQGRQGDPPDRRLSQARETCSGEARGSAASTTSARKRRPRRRRRRHRVRPRRHRFTPRLNGLWGASVPAAAMRCACDTAAPAPRPSQALVLNGRETTLIFPCKSSG